MQRISDLIVGKFYFEFFSSHLKHSEKQETKKCDNCGSKEIHKELNSPLNIKIYVCEKCWNEFLSNS